MSCVVDIDNRIVGNRCRPSWSIFTLAVLRETRIERIIFGIRRVVAHQTRDVRDGEDAACVAISAYADGGRKCIRTIDFGLVLRGSDAVVRAVELGRALVGSAARRRCARAACVSRNYAELGDDRIHARVDRRRRRRVDRTIMRLRTACGGMHGGGGVERRGGGVSWGPWLWVVVLRKTAGRRSGTAEAKSKNRKSSSLSEMPITGEKKRIRARARRGERGTAARLLETRERSVNVARTRV